MSQRCVECGGRQLVRGQATETWKVGDRTIRVRIPRWECGACGERYYDGPDLERAELTVAAEVSRGEPIGAAFKLMRRALGLGGSELGALLDVTPETVSRWENDRRPIDRSAWITLGTLVSERLHGSNDAFARLAALRDGRSRRARTVRLDLAKA